MREGVFVYSLHIPVVLVTDLVILKP